MLYLRGKLVKKYIKIKVMRVQEVILKIEEPTREDKIKQLIKYLDGMLEFDSKIGTVVDCGACSNNGCKVCK
jgi:predicted metal-dependent RNase